MSKSAFMVISIIVLLNSSFVGRVRFYDDDKDKDPAAADDYDDE